MVKKVTGVDFTGTESDEGDIGADQPSEEKGVHTSDNLPAENNHRGKEERQNGSPCIFAERQAKVIMVELGDLDAAAGGIGDQGGVRNKKEENEGYPATEGA